MNFFYKKSYNINVSNLIVDNMNAKKLKEDKALIEERLNNLETAIKEGEHLTDFGKWLYEGDKADLEKINNQIKNLK
jgi:hypothetical protein